MTAIESSAPGVERQQVALVAQQHRRALGRDAGDLAVRRVAEHLARALLVDVRVVEQPQAQLRLQHPPDAASSVSSLTAPCSTASGRWAYAGSAIAISMSTPAFTARAPASVRSAAKPCVDEVADRVGVADHEPLEAPASPRSTSVNSQRLPVAGMPLRSM